MQINDDFIERLWEDYQCHCIDSHIELLEREEYITNAQEYYGSQIEVRSKTGVHDKAFAIKVGQELFFPIRGRDQKQWYHLSLLLLPLNPKFTLQKYKYLEVIKGQYPDDAALRANLICFKDKLKTSELTNAKDFSALELEMVVKTGFFEQFILQVLTFPSAEDARLFYDLVLTERHFKEITSYSNVWSQKETYIACQFKENKRLILQDHTIHCLNYWHGLIIDYHEGIHFFRDESIVEGWNTFTIPKKD